MTVEYNTPVTEKNDGQRFRIAHEPDSERYVPEAADDEGRERWEAAFTRLDVCS